MIQSPAQEVSDAKPATSDARYEAPILMHPDAYAYYTVEPGVELKWLGRFHDHTGPHGDLRIAMLRLSGGGNFQFAADRAQLAWTTSDGLLIDGRRYPKLTCLYSPRGELSVISGEDGVELCLVEFPRLT